MIDISDLDKAAVLVALYENARTQGLGFLKATSEPLTVERARKLLARQTYFDYLYGRVLKVELGGDTLETWLYDRDNGQGAAQRVIDGLKAKKESNA